eukprot:UN14184
MMTSFFGLSCFEWNIYSHIYNHRASQQQPWYFKYFFTNNTSTCK